MLFNHLIYLQATHYFQLFRKDGTSVFPRVDLLPQEILKQLTPDSNFTSAVAKEYDLSWQALNKGYIGGTASYASFEKVPIEDEYRFIRKYFHPVWVLYVLLLRLLSFKNPIKEILAYHNTRNVKRSTYLQRPITNDGWQTFDSALVLDAPLVSVVIPTLNRYTYLKDVLSDLEQQDYKNFEVLVVDQSVPFQSDFYKAFDLNLRVIKQEEKALWLARNTAIKEAKGEFIALSEDDVRVNADWISTHLKCINFFKAQVSAGVFYPEGQEIPKERSFFTLASQFATGNAMLYKGVFKQVGLFDRQFEKQRMGDGEFGMRVYLAGLKSVSNPYASCIDVKAGTGGLREMGSWDAFRPSNFFAPRPIPSVLYYFRKYFGKRAALLSLLRTVPISIFPYQFKKNKPFLVLGVLLSVLLLPVVVMQVVWSWRLASKKLKEGALIEELKTKREE
ncbi:glycosyltransferase family A protein [Oceanihabitans sediminis]|uniref:glycosyltransferase family 2 protein n=1 Tax=Oceanihabitans sediminis TaxID=1812012 RepID=UPI00299D6A29|nr:glycosyltransferase family A protein [Oceanihabitans sediminis]MDX1774844.1 glycosyltransferase family A protein [Oceanihabitans sediminis]